MFAGFLPLGGDLCYADAGDVMEKSERLLEEEYSTYEALRERNGALAADLLCRRAGGACVWSVVCSCPMIIWP